VTNSAQPEYALTAADLDRIDRVHALITAHPDEFVAAGKSLDEQYSAVAIAKRADEQNRLYAEAKLKDPRVSGSEFTAPSSLFVAFAIPECYMGEKPPDFWDEPTRRWEVLLCNLIRGRLPITLPSTDWSLPSEVLLIYWITCDERAERGPRLSAFQDWPWDGERPFWRRFARCWVEDWPKFNSAVDFALALAERRGLITPPDDQSLEDQWVTLDQAAAVSGLSKRTLEKRLKAGALPKAGIAGGGGRASSWNWSELRPKLAKYSRRPLPERFPTSRILPSS
jgi:hypothetical protein